MNGILPAAGTAARIYGVPKFLLPIPGSYLLKWHIDQMLKAGAGNVYIGANSDNEPLLRKYAGRGCVYQAERCATMTETVQSLPYYAHSDVMLFGMPDTCWTAEGVYARLAEAVKEADIAVAVWRARPGQHKRGGMCQVDADGRVLEVIDKPEDSTYEWIWGALAWRADFWQHTRNTDSHVGIALPRAIEAGLNVRAVCFDGGYYDCGTMTGYYELVSEFANQGAL